MKLDECKGVMFDFYITLFCFLSWYPIIDEKSLSILYIAVIIKFSVIEFIKRNNIPIFINAKGKYIQKFNPLLFFGLSLPWTKTRPKHNEGVA